MQFLDFEKPIQDLYEELDRIREVSKKSKVDLSASISDIEKKIEESKKSLYKNLSGWQRVQLSRHPERPYTLEYIERISEGFVELFGDRNVKDDKAMVGGFGQIQGQTVMFVGHQKGNTTKQRQYRNFGMANPEGYRKALRLMKMAEKFNKPIVCLIDTPGAFPGIEGEERGQAEAIARNIQDMFLLTVPVVCVIIGEGASGGAIGIGVGDRVFMMENTWYSVISPESCSSILWRSWEHKERAAEALKLTAKDMLGNGLIDGIIKEPLGGAHVNPEEAAKNLQKKIVESLKELIPMDAEERIQERMAKFVKMGVFHEA
jgi:acetyl-CoA carboxylase carboxyl transferase subunit alpha